MRRIRFLLYKEFRQFFRDKVMLRIVIVMPVFMLILLGNAVTTDVKNISTVICDLDHSQTSRELIEKIQTSGYFNITISDEGLHRINRYLDSGKATLGLVIPRNFEQELQREQPGNIQIIINGEDAKSAQIAMGYLNNIIRAFSQNIFFERVSRNPQLALKIHMLDPVTRIWYNPNLESVNYMVPGIVAMLITVFSMFFTAMAIVREKEDGTLEQLLVTPITSLQLILGKTIPYVIIAFIDGSLVMLLGKLIFNVPIVGSLWLLFLFLFIYILSTLGLGIFISTVSQTQMQALFLSWFVMVLMFILSGFFIPIANMPQWIRHLTLADPLRYMITAIREIFLKGSNLENLWQPGAAMLGYGLFIITLSSLRFQKRIK